MYIRNIDTGKWSNQVDTLPKNVYDNIKEDFEKVKLYSKCLSGSTYLPTSDLDNIYETLDIDKIGFYVKTTNSITTYPPNGPQIVLDQSSSDEFYNKYLKENAFTLKNHFTPEKLIKDQVENFLKVDVATDGLIDDLSVTETNLVIDGVRVVEGNKILVKDQTTDITLASSIDPEDYFTNILPVSEYTIIEDSVTAVTYRYYNEQNGIYEYLNNKLIKTDDLDNYDKSYRMAVSIETGDLNKGNEYNLLRLKTGYFPIESNNIQFSFRENWMIRNQVDYNNIFDLNYYDVINHSTQSVFVESDSRTYSIPPRTIAVGEFGVIINNQDKLSLSATFSKSNIINNKFKVNLRSITEVGNYYWICGDEGTLLRVSKHDYSIKKIELNETSSLTSVDFFNDLNGMVVGKFNSIYWTNDGGFNWEKVSYPEFDAFSYNKVVYPSLTNAYIGGESGVFIELTLLSGVWISYKRKVSRKLDEEDEYILFDDINDIYKTDFGSTQSDVLLICTNNDNIIAYDVDNYISDEQFLYLSTTQSHSDIKSIFRRPNSDEIYISGDRLYKFDINDFFNVGSQSNVSSGSTTLIDDIYSNKIYLSDDKIYLAGNNSSLKFSEYSNINFNLLDPNFNDGLTSRLLFLDYDVASKLNFFTDDGEYRLANSVTLNTSTLSVMTFSSVGGEKNWIDYYKDAEKTFKYYSTISDSDKVEFSTTFELDLNNTFNYVGSDVSINLSEILPLAPNINGKTSSRFIEESTPIASTYDTNFDILLYKYLSIFKNISAKVGDVIRIESDVIDCNLVVNRIEAYVNTNNSNQPSQRVTLPYSLGPNQYLTTYAYCYSDFNGNIIKNLKNSNTIKVINLNKFDSVEKLVTNFNKHIISIGYEMSLIGDMINVNQLFNNKTAYYNMQTSISTDIENVDMLYDNSFLDFGYSPTYNILGYLSKIDSSVFNSNKIFTTLPRYLNLTGNDGNTFTQSNIFIDLSEGLVTGTNSYYRTGTNKVVFGSDYKFNWDSLLLHTFIDLKMYPTSGSPYPEVTNERMLITKKYYDESLDGYVIEFHKKIELPVTIPPNNYNVSSFDFLSRNSLGQISSDLQLLNNIQRTEITKSVQYLSSFTSLDNELLYKFPTDSYLKVLVSDFDIREYLSAIIYTDDKNRISMNVLNLEEKKEYKIVSTFIQQSTNGFSQKLGVLIDGKHDLIAGDLIFLEFDGGQNSSESLNPSYFGLHTVIDSVSSNNISYVITSLDPNIPSLSQDTGVIKILRKDPFFNYQPIDLIKIGSDKKVTRSIKIDPENTEIEGKSYKLVNLDFNRYRIRLVDGLYFDEVFNNYSWILEAEISDAIIGKDNNGIVWYSGTWHCGRWFGGTWNSGNWVSGDWYSGTWNSYNTLFEVNRVKVDTSYIDDRVSKWFGGRWFDGSWNGGTWYDGRRYSGNWKQGIWYNGIWNDGNWESGQFFGGIWVLGNWESGVFNSNIRPAYWLDGEFKSGDFENGIWYDGSFGNNDGIVSRFGTKSNNSRPSIWHSGIWINGEFHSLLNQNDLGEPIVSDIHKYSIWRTGRWLSGQFYGGVAYNIDFKSGTWVGGILEEIQVIGVDQILPAQTSNNAILLNGIFKFNIGDEIWVIDDYRGYSYSPLGSNDSPRKYRVNKIEEFEEVEQTKVYLNFNLSTLGVTPSIASATYSDVETGLRVVSYFKDSTWDSGLWTNGIFESGKMNSVIWYNGIFNGTWGN